MPTRNEPALSRVVVALDAAADFGASIDVAASVARSLEIGLHAMLVEDENLQRAAGLPFMQAVDLSTARRASLDLGAMQREMGLIAARVRRLLENAAAEQALKWSFEIRQGAIGAELAGLKQDELLALGLGSRPLVGMARMRSPWRPLAGSLRQPLLLIPELPVTGGGVVALHGHAGADRHVIETSIRIARAWRKPLTVLMPATTASAEQAKLRDRLHDELADAKLRSIAAPSPEALRSFIASAAVSLTVLCREYLSEDGDRESFLGAPPSPLLLL